MDSENSPTLESLLTQLSEKDIRIQQLLKSAEEQKKYASDIKLQNEHLMKENKEFRTVNNEVLTTNFSHDQIRKMSRKCHNQGWRWSNDTVEAAIRARLATGHSGYNYLLRELNYPFPSIRTINRRLENLKLPPGNICVHCL